MPTDPTTSGFQRKHLLGIEGLQPFEIADLLEQADGFVGLNRQADKKLQLLKGLTQINLFFESSTRTQTSFELAGKRLGADVVNMSVASSAMKKGETLIDTAMTLNAMHPDVLVVRHQDSGAVALLARHVRCCRDQRRRRRARASDPGAARRADHPPPQGPDRGPDRGDLRRHPAQPGGALEHPAAAGDGRQGARGGARPRCCRPASRASASRCSPTCSAASRTSTS